MLDCSRRCLSWFLIYLCTLPIAMGSWAMEEAVVLTTPTILYADLLLRVPVAKLSAGEVIQISEKILRNGRVAVTALDGRVLYVELSALSLNREQVAEAKMQLRSQHTTLMAWKESNLGLSFHQLPLEHQGTLVRAGQVETQPLILESGQTFLLSGDFYWNKWGLRLSGGHTQGSVQPEGSHESWLLRTSLLRTIYEARDWRIVGVTGIHFAPLSEIDLEATNISGRYWGGAVGAEIDYFIFQKILVRAGALVTHQRFLKHSSDDALYTLEGFSTTGLEWLVGLVYLLP